MANIKSAAKRAALAETRRERNASIKSSAKTAIRRFDEALRSGDIDSAGEKLIQAVRRLDKATTKGVIHPRTTARKKSRLYARFNNMKKQAE
ncbi:MAG: 30S ribosomal protein S20 [Clostridia bacterium]|nr:MAG: 30S ribosomal protein S20 [Clostridia bacterium]